MPVKAWSDDTGNTAWKSIKVSFAFFWMIQIMGMARTAGDCLYPVGVCKWYSFDFLLTHWGIWILAGSVVLLLYLYLREKYMVAVTAALSVLSCIVISRHESSGIMLRATPFTTVFIAQFLAYLFHSLNPEFKLAVYRQQYAVQIIAATYTLSAISKFSSSGLEWIDTGAAWFALPVVKSFSFAYFDTGNTALLQKGYGLAHYLLTHKGLVKFLLGASLLLEATCMLVTVHPKLKFIYGCALLLMHLGIAYSMNIVIGGVFYPMLIFFVNPVYRLVWGWHKLAPVFQKKPTAVIPV